MSVPVTPDFIPLGRPGDFIVPIVGLPEGGDIHEHLRFDPLTGELIYGGTTVRLPGDSSITIGWK